MAGARFARDTLPRLRAAYIEPGRAFIAHRNYPLESIHPDAFGAAVLAKCAGRLNQFWTVHDLLFASPRPELGEAALLTTLSKAQIDPQLLAGCRASDGPKLIRAEMQAASALGVSSTPLFLVGLRQSDGSVKITDVMAGAKPFEAFDAVLKRLESDK